jgi:hypothetical protein
LTGNVDGRVDQTNDHLLTGDSSAAFLAQPAGVEFIEKLWAEIVADIEKYNPQLKIYGLGSKRQWV